MPAFSPDISGNQGIGSSLSFLLEDVRLGQSEAARIVAGFAELTTLGLTIRGVEQGEIPQDIIDIITPLVERGDPSALEERAILSEMRRQQWQSVGLFTGQPQNDVNVVSATIPGPIVVLGVQTISSNYTTAGNDGQFNLFATTPGSANTLPRESGSMPVFPSDNRLGFIRFNPNGTFFVIRRLIELPSIALHIRWLSDDVIGGVVQWIVMFRSLRF